ncbi:MAG: acyl-CoA dehydrogenase family protein [Burkholderiaceae bacterium]
MTRYHQDLLTEIQAFAREKVAPLAANWAFGETPSQSLLEEAAKLGLTGIQVPEEFGGHGLDFAHKTKACEVLAAFDFGLSMSLVNTQNVARKIALMAPKPIAQKFVPGLLSGKVTACTALTEPGAGSDFAAITTCATRQSGGWELNGEKAWIINGRHAGVSVVFAKCEDLGNGVQATGGESIGAFLVDLDAPGVRRYAIDSSFSQTSMGTGGFVFSGVAVPAEHLLLPPGTAFKSALGEINGARTYVAAMCCAMLRAALAQASDYGARRHTFGKPLAAHQAWRHDLVKVQTDLAAARALTDHAIELVSNQGDAQLAAAQAKIQAVEACQGGLPVLLHAMGAEGLRSDYCFTRHLGASQVAAFTDGSTAMLRERVARLQSPVS